MFLLACVNIQKNIAGVAFLDISTGEFFTTEGKFEYIDKLLNSMNPKEVLFERSCRNEFLQLFGDKFYTFMLDDWVFNEETANERLLKQFDTVSLKGFGVQNLKYGNVAASAILQYLDLTHHQKTGHITRLSRIEEERYVWLDKFTIRNLELTASINLGGKSLIDIIDKTISPMGGRLLKRWLALPLKDIQPINNRLNVVEHFLSNQATKESIETYIKQIGDLERIISKVALQRISPRGVVQLKNALNAIVPIKQSCIDSGEASLKKIAEQLNPCNTIKERIEKDFT